jgi:hypothetical protein
MVDFGRASILRGGFGNLGHGRDARFEAEP